MSHPLHNRMAEAARRLFISMSAICVLGAPGASSAADPVRQIDAKDFLGSLGVNVHFNYKDTSYVKQDAAIQDLNYLGVRRVRQAFPFAWSKGGVELGDIVHLSRAGLVFDFVVEPRNDLDTALLLQRADEIESAAPGTIEAVEGFNEIDNRSITYQGQTGTAGAVAAMRALYAAVHGDPRLQGAAVFDMTSFPIGPSLAGRADFANSHPYPHNGRPPVVVWNPGRPDVPRVITEIGNFSLPADWPKDKPWWEGYTMLGIDENSQAKSILMSYLDGAESGYYRTYIYELLDEKPDPLNNQPEYHFGLFRTDHSPKAAATAVHNLVRFLNDAGAREALPKGAAPIEVDAPPDGVRQLMIRKGEKSWALAIWTDAPFWKWTGPKAFPVEAQPVPVRLKLDRKLKSLTLADPLTGKTEALPLRDDGSVEIPGYPVLILAQE